VENYCKKLETL